MKKNFPWNKTPIHPNFSRDQTIATPTSWKFVRNDELEKKNLMRQLETKRPSIIKKMFGKVLGKKLG